MIRLIAAVDRQYGIAKHGRVPWKISDDLKHFSKQTKLYGGNLLTGAKTFRQTYPGPLLGRQNYILTNSKQAIEGAIVVNNLNEFVNEFKTDLWVAGGAKVFELTIGYADELYLTHIDADFGCDQFFPNYKDKFKLVDDGETLEQNGFEFKFCVYKKSS